MADSLIAAGYAHEVLITCLAVGGAAVADWAPGGPYNHRLMYALDRLQGGGMVPTHVLWHQGEADALYGTSQADYAASFARIAASIRNRGIAAPIYMATAAYFAIPEGYHAQQQAIRTAQRTIIDGDAGILAGPDTDLILDRYDGCHMDTAGLRKHAAEWFKVLTSTSERSRGADCYPTPQYGIDSGLA